MFSQKIVLHEPGQYLGVAEYRHLPSLLKQAISSYVKKRGHSGWLALLSLLSGSDAMPPVDWNALHDLTKKIVEQRRANESISMHLSRGASHVYIGNAGDLHFVRAPKQLEKEIYNPILALHQRLPLLKSRFK